MEVIPGAERKRRDSVSAAVGACGMVSQLMGLPLRSPVTSAKLASAKETRGGWAKR